MNDEMRPPDDMAHPDAPVPPAPVGEPLRPGERVESLGVYEMIWDCKFCGSERLPARTHQFCPNCGAAQDPRTRRFPSDADKIAVKDHVYKGASLICASCSTPNDGDAKFCRQCGAPLENAERAATLAAQTRAETEVFAEGAVREVEAEELKADLAAAGATAAPANASNRTMLLIGGAIALVVIGILVAVFWQRSTNAVLVGHRWERVIEIESFAARLDGAWCDAMPVDAYSISRSQRQRSSRQVPDGEECRVVNVDQGDGTFRQERRCETVYREEPIYDTWCSFTVNRWGYSRSVNATGASLNDQPVWPETRITRTGSCLGCEREGGRDEDYVLVLRSGENEYTCAVAFELWRGAPLESQWTLDIGVVTGQPDCGSLARAG